jgi:hypothetical protein
MARTKKTVTIPAANKPAFITDGVPSKSGVYIVDYDPAYGTAYRYYNTKTGKWGRLEWSVERATKAKDAPTKHQGLGWRTLDGQTVESDTTVSMIASSASEPAPVVTPKAPGKRRGRPVGATAAETKPDGTIVFRADRNKWIAWMNGHQEAARDTKEKAMAFLTKKYGVTEFTFA